MEFAVIGHLESIDVLPANLLIVCHALRLVCVKLIDSTISVHLCLLTLFNLCSMAITDDSTYSLDVAHWCCWSSSLHLLSQPGMYVLL